MLVKVAFVKVGVTVDAVNAGVAPVVATALIVSSFLHDANTITARQPSAKNLVINVFILILKVKY